MDKDKAEVLRYLGYRGQEVSQELETMAEECLNELRKAVKPRYVEAELDINVEKDGIRLNGAGLLLPGEDIRLHLASCRKAVVFAATLGIEADNLIRIYENIDMTRALVLDACATYLIEHFCGKIESDVREVAKKAGFMTVPRYSPGYGDFSLDIQPKLLAVLDAARKIGLTCTNSLIMLPRKSVTAIIGIGECDTLKRLEKDKNCEVCSQNKNCIYRR